MNNSVQVDQLVEAIMRIEREFINDRLIQDAAAKKTAVNAIMEEIEKVMTDED